MRVAASGRSEVLGRAASVSAMLDAVARRLEGGRAGSRFPLLQLIRREGAVSAPECGALVFEVARLQSMLGSLPCEADASSSDEREAGGFPRPPGATPPRTLADAFAWPLWVLDHFARLGHASGDGTRVESDSSDPVAPAAAATPGALAPAR